MLLPSHLRRSRHGVYYFRIVLPDSIASALGQRELVHVNRQKVMHSFRDTVSDMLGIGDMDEFGADQWTGHAPQGIKAKHYRSKVAITIQAVEGFKALDFPFIDTERIQYRKGWWNEWTVKEMKP